MLPGELIVSVLPAEIEAVPLEVKCSLMLLGMVKSAVIDSVWLIKIVCSLAPMAVTQSLRDEKARESVQEAEVEVTIGSLWNSLAETKVDSVKVMMRKIV
jgi:hypothetical protein